MKSFKSNAWMLPPLGRRTLARQEPVLIIGTYDKGGTCDIDNIMGGYHGRPNAMNAAWGVSGICMKS